MDKDLQQLRDRLMDELRTENSKAKEMTPQCLETMYKLVETIKGIDKIDMLEEASGYAEDYYSNTYNGTSYRRQPRDSMGRYSGTRYRYSRHDRNEAMAEYLEEKLQNAPSEKARDAIETVLAMIRLG